MAYSKNLEDIIDAALADGVLTDKERAVLHKKAAQEGVDPDELDVVIDGRLAKMKKQEDWLRPTPPSKEKLGNIVTCPACGAIVPSGVAVCPECGHVFSNVQANSSATVLASKLEELASGYEQKFSSGDIFDKALGIDSKRVKLLEQQASVVANFPIPNTRGDLLEFLASMKAKAELVDEDTDVFQKACKAKYKECVLKARMNFSNDPAFQEYVKLSVGEQLSKKFKGLFGLK